MQSSLQLPANSPEKANEVKSEQVITKLGKLIQHDPILVQDASAQYEHPERHESKCEALQTAKDYCTRSNIGYLTHSWAPPNGIPSEIVSNAQESGYIRAQREELARCETFLFQKYIGRMPEKSSHLNGRTFRKLIELQLAEGKWLMVKDSCDYFEESKLRRLSPVYMLSPKYMREIASKDTISGRYSTLTSNRILRQRKPKPGGMSESMTTWFSNGGIEWNPILLLAMLSSPVDLLIKSEQQKEWNSLLEDWRQLSIFTAHRPLQATWMVRRRGWLFARKPALQMLSSKVRSSVLSVKGSKLVEADYSSCQLNILNHHRGIGIKKDPLRDLVNLLKNSHGIDLSRSQLKQLLYPLFYGRKKFTFLQVAELELNLCKRDAKGIWIALQPFRIESGKYLMEQQGKILMRALSILDGLGSDTVLPIFDSILSIDPEFARFSMEEASKQVLKTRHPIPVVLKH